MTAEFIAVPDLAVPNGFFTRNGGVSTGPFASLNCSLSGQDARDHVLENRARVARALGADPAALVGLTQVHGADTVTVTHAWPPGAGPRADACVTNQPGIALGIVTADCAPVLFADRRHCLIARCRIAEANHQRRAFARDAVMADVLVAQQAAQVGAGRIKPLGQRALHVHLQQEVHTAAQIEAEVHRQRMHAGEPARRIGYQVQRNAVRGVIRVRVERLFNGIPGLQLCIGIGKAHTNAVGV